MALGLVAWGHFVLSLRCRHGGTLRVHCKLGKGLKKGSTLMNTYEEQCEHLEGIYIELCDLKPSQQRYRDDVLIKDEREYSMADFMGLFYDATKLPVDSGLMAVTQYIDSDKNENFPPLHGEMLLPFGAGFLALLNWPELVKKFDLERHSNPSVRLIIAYYATDKEILESLSFDRCALVRAEVAANSQTSDDTRYRLARDPYLLVREQASMRIAEPPEIDSSQVSNFEIDECVCDVDNDLGDFDNFFSDEGLEMPMVAAHMENELIEFGSWHWATQPFPGGIDDYLLFETVKYLKGAVPDQYSLSHAGHGINSYSLNFRHAAGDMAMIVQVGWGGIYYDREEATRKWDSVVQEIDTTLQLTADISEEIFQRKFLIVSSDFRMEQELEFWQNEDGKWKQLPEIDSWVSANDYLYEHYDELQI